MSIIGNFRICSSQTLNQYPAVSYIKLSTIRIMSFFSSLSMDIILEELFKDHGPLLIGRLDILRNIKCGGIHNLESLLCVVRYISVPLATLNPEVPKAKPFSI